MVYDEAGERTHKMGGNGNSFYFDPLYTAFEDTVGKVYRRNLYEEFTYTPHGEVWRNQSATINPEGLNFKVPYTFTGKEFDEEIGLYYNSARYRDPKRNIWMSVDPMLPELINPASPSFSPVEARTPYGYVANNPVKYTDPTGMAGEGKVSSGIGKMVKGVGKVLAAVTIMSVADYFALQTGGAATGVAMTATAFAWSLGSSGVYNVADGFSDLVMQSNKTDTPESLPTVVGGTVDSIRSDFSGSEQNSTFSDFGERIDKLEDGVASALNLGKLSAKGVFKGALTGSTQTADASAETNETSINNEEISHAQ